MLLELDDLVEACSAQIRVPSRSIKEHLNEISSINEFY
jgi:hypothetical protein